MRVFLVNPSHVSFGTAVITPRWLYVLAGATPSRYGDPILVDETLDPFEATQLAPGDVVGIGIHTANALRGYEVGQLARARGAYVVFGGIHSTLYPNEAHAAGRRARRCPRGRRCRLGDRHRRLRRRNAAWGYTKRDKLQVRDLHARPVGSLAQRPVHVGDRSRRCAGARSIARSARCGAQMARPRGKRPSRT